MQLFKEYQIIPQELVDHIISFVPEYGHRLTKELHQRSLEATNASVYCDFYRYCARSTSSPIITCIDIYEKGSVAEDLDNGITRYLTKNLRELICMYLNDLESVSKGIFPYIGITSMHRISDVDFGYYDAYNLYKCIDYRAKVIELYSLMIIRDVGLMTKKEFEAKCLVIDDLAIRLEIVFSIFIYEEHIYSVAIRYFSSEPIMSIVVERLNTRAAVNDGIMFGDVYSYDDEHMLQYIEYNNTAKKMDRGSLRKIRDQILSIVPGDAYYESDRIDRIDVRQALFMVESLADEE